MVRVNEMRPHAATMEGAMHSVNSVIKSKSKMDCMYDVRCPSELQWTSHCGRAMSEQTLCIAMWKLTSNGFGSMVQRTHRAYDFNGRTLLMQHCSTLAPSDWHRVHLIRLPNVATQSVAKDGIEVMTIGCKQICDLSPKSKWKRFRCSMRVWMWIGYGSKCVDGNRQSYGIKRHNFLYFSNAYLH